MFIRCLFVIKTQESSSLIRHKWVRIIGSWISFIIIDIFNEMIWNENYSLAQHLIHSICNPLLLNYLHCLMYHAKETLWASTSGLETWRAPSSIIWHKRLLIRVSTAAAPSLSDLKFDIAWALFDSLSLIWLRTINSIMCDCLLNKPLNDLRHSFTHNKSLAYWWRSARGRISEKKTVWLLPPI